MTAHTSIQTQWQVHFAVDMLNKHSVSAEGRKYIALFWALDAFLTSYPEALVDFTPAIAVLADLLRCDRDSCKSSRYQAYLHAPIPSAHPTRLTKELNGNTIREVIATGKAQVQSVPANPVTVRNLRDQITARINATSTTH